MGTIKKDSKNVGRLNSSYTAAEKSTALLLRMKTGTAALENGLGVSQQIKHRVTMWPSNSGLCLVAQSCSTLCDPMDYSPPGSSVHGDSPGKNTGVSCHALPPEDLPSPRIKPRSPTLQVDSLPSEPPGKSKNTGVGRIFLLQRLFPIQKSNWGFLHCRQILYQLSYLGIYPRE